MKTILREQNVNGLDIRYLEFPEGDILVKNIVFGEIINSVPSPKAKPKQLAWKQHVASEVFNLTKNKVIDPSLTFAISLNMRFYPINHPGKFDIDNFVKPILDGIAAGLFCDRGMDPSSFERFNFDDSNFKHLYLEKLRDTTNPKEEGVAIVVSKLTKNSEDC